MVNKYREQFNSLYSEEKYRNMIADLEDESGTNIAFRIAESPVFLPPDFREKLLDACESIIDQIKNLPEHFYDGAVPEKYKMPGKKLRPHFLTIDFGICRSTEGEIEPQLIELQAFPSMYAYQKVLRNAYIKTYPFLEKLQPQKNDDVYFAKIKKLILAEENPENVVLLEIYPEKQKTQVDFIFTEKFLGIKTVCLTKVIQEGKKLFYDNDGQRTQIKRIYNRVIFDELECIPDLQPGFNFRDELEVDWVTHPEWFFRISKYILPVLDHQYVPKSYFADEFPAAEELENFVLKPLFSFAGSGVNLNPSPEDLKTIKNGHDFILQRKVRYAPIIRDIKGDFSKCEVRMLYIWYQGADMPELVENLARLTKADMVNVDFNKKDAVWIGGSTAFFSN